MCGNHHLIGFRQVLAELMRIRRSIRYFWPFSRESRIDAEGKDRPYGSWCDDGVIGRFV
jgi:hypothetical protein